MTHNKDENWQDVLDEFDLNMAVIENSPRDDEWYENEVKASEEVPDGRDRSQLL